MREYTIVCKKPEHNWDNVPVLNVDNQQWVEPLPIKMQAQICYDNKAMYLRMQVVEPNIRAEETGPLGAPYKDSCMEFFFCPTDTDNRYFNFEFNPNLCMVWRLNRGAAGSVRLIPDMSLLNASANRTDDGWVLEYQIPHALIQQFYPNYLPASGGHIRANVYKCGHETVHPHYHTWNYVDMPKPCFHCPEHFGLMHFE